MFIHFISFRFFDQKQNFYLCFLNIQRKNIFSAQGYRAELDSSHTVSQFVQRRRPAHDAHHIGNNQQNSSGNSRFSRQTHLEQMEEELYKQVSFMSKAKVSSSQSSKVLTWNANCPEKSYMPQECIRLRVFRTASGLRTRSPVIGQKPPLAKVAAMTLALSQVTSIEQSWWKGTESCFYRNTSEVQTLLFFKSHIQTRSSEKK